MPAKYKSVVFVLRLFAAFIILISASLSSQAASISVRQVEVHTVMSRAELCLVFNGAFEERDRAKILKHIVLRDGARLVEMPPHDLSLSNGQLCVQNLSYRKRYHFSFLKMAGGLAEDYKVSFTVPDRPRILSFMNGGGGDEIPTLQNKPQLRSVNVPRAQLLLYKIADPALYKQALQKYKSHRLAPTESLVFARSKGELIFESDLRFNKTPNMDQVLNAPMPEKQALVPALYYLAALPYKDEKAPPELFAGQWFSTEVAQKKALQEQAVKPMVVIAIDRDHTQPGEHLTVQMTGREVGRLELVRPDGLVQQSFSYKKTQEITLPYTGLIGLWKLQWRDESGKLLAKRPFYLSHDLSIQAIKAFYEDEHLVIRAFDRKGKRTPYKNGLITVKCERPVSKKWHGFAFGLPADTACQDKEPISFITDYDGEAILLLNRDEHWRQSLTISFEGSAVSATHSLEALPVSRRIGIKPDAAGGLFTENSEASFEIVSLGNARGRLYYTIYEIGRSFEWFTSDEGWSYKRQPQHRRIGGGHFVLMPGRTASLSWPVTTGSYMIEIADEHGIVLAQKSFEAGRRGQAQSVSVIPEGTKAFVKPLQKTKQVERVLSYQDHLLSTPVTYWQEMAAKITDGSAFEVKDKGLFYVAPAPVAAIAQPFEKLARYTPQTTAERSKWLRAMSLWNRSLITMGLLSSEEWPHIMKRQLHQILYAQNYDGGFTAYQQHGAGDIAQTAEALYALYAYGDGAYGFEASRAEAWLSGALKNTWYPEEEREARAYALAILAQLGKTDLAAIEYFAESSRNAELTLLTRASLAHAYASVGEKAKAKLWFDAIPLDLMIQDADVLALLSGYEALSYEDVADAWQKGEGQDLLASMQALAGFMNRQKSWHVEVDGQRIKHIGIAPIKAKFRNVSGRDLFVIQKHKRTPSSQSEQVSRKLYKVSGVEVPLNSKLRKGRTYVLVITGQVDAHTKLVQPSTSSFDLELIGDGRPSVQKENFGWLVADKAAALHVAYSDDGVMMSLPSGIAWQEAFLLKPKETGVALLPALEER